VALQALDRLCSGVIVSDDGGRVVEMNRGAEAMVDLEDGLAVRNGQLCARRAFETAKMSKLISAAAGVGKTGGAAGHMLIGRGDGRPAYVLTVAPLDPDLAIGNRPLAMIIIVDPARYVPSEKDLADLFGLSPAEARVAAALMTGKSLADIAAGSGVQITTVRTQLHSILRKVGVKRQFDLVRILSSTGISSSIPLSAWWFDAALAAAQIPVNFAA
jgi:DNA-binding CsgD family transcriptional regulator